MTPHPFPAITGVPVSKKPGAVQAELDSVERVEVWRVKQQGPAKTAEPLGGRS
jgi:hypothetical protein